MVSRPLNSCSTHAVNSTSSSVPSSASSRRAVLVAGGLIVLAGFAAYHNTFSAPFVFDSPTSITGNPTIRRLWPIWPVLSPASNLTVGGRPIANLSLAINYAISGEAVWSYHALNLAIHLLAGLVLFGIVRRTLSQPRLRARFGDVALTLACAAAGLWLLHPLQTESVTYVIQRTESLAGLFYLLTLYGFIRATESCRETGGPAADAGHSPSARVGGHARRPPAGVGWLAFSFAACLLGMATKEIMASAPLLVLVYDRTFVSGGFRAALRQRRRYYLALAATWILLGWLVASTHNRGGTAGFDSGLSPAIYLLSQCYAIVVYLKLSFWPHPLVFDYGLGVIEHAADVWPQAVLLGAMAGGTAIALRRRSPVGFVGLWFFAILAPSSSLVPIGSQTMAEHRIYLPLAAVIVLVVTGLHASLGRRSLVLWPALAIALGGLTVQRNNVYRSDLALWRDAVAKRPLNPRARYDLGIAFSDRGQFAEAVPQYEEALRLDQGSASGNQTQVIHTKLGHHLVVLGRVPEAVAHYREALRLKPDYALAHHNLAQALVLLDQFSEAIRHYEEALRLNLGGAETHADLGYALLHEGRVEEAIPHYREALRLAPNSAPGFNNLAYALLVTGRVAESISAYREALRLDPRYAAASAGLGYALIQAGQPAEAVTPCEQALRLQPDFADAHNTLGIALARTGRIPEAIAHFEQALRLDGRLADAHNNLGNALSAAVRPAEAIRHYEAALRLKPDYAQAHRNLAEELQRAGRTAEAAEHFEAAARLEAGEKDARTRVSPPTAAPSPAGP